MKKHRPNNDVVRKINSKEWVPKYLDVVAVIFVTALLVSNLGAQKLFKFGPATFTAGILVFPINYIFGDVLTEVYGFRRARRVIYMGLLANVFMAGCLMLAISLPPAPGWDLQSAFKAVHSLVPRIVMASIFAYVSGEIVNSIVLSKLKVAMDGRRLWVRTISSTISGQLIDTGIFAVVAFGGVLPWGLVVSAALSGWVFKVVYEMIATPLTYWVISRLKRLEGVDHFDVEEKIALF